MLFLSIIYYYHYIRLGRGLYCLLVSQRRAELGGAASVDVLEVGLRVDAAGAVVIPQAGPPHVQGVQVGGRAPAQAAEGALQGVAERLPELAVEVGVDKGVQGRVEVANPEHQDHHHVRVLDSEHRVGHVPAAKQQQPTITNMCANML